MKKLRSVVLEKNNFELSKKLIFVSVSFTNYRSTSFPQQVNKQKGFYSPSVE